LATLRAVADLEEGELLDAIDEAERSALIAEAPSRGLAYCFSHELIRRAVVERLSAPRRAELHLRVAEALERDESSMQPSRLAALAHHFAAAVPLGGSERAVRYNVLAAHAAITALAFDDAAERLRIALSLGVSDLAERALAYLELGSASHRAGNALDALEAFSHTAKLARDLGDSELLARAAIGLEEACWRPKIYEDGTVELLQEAAAALEANDSELRTRLLRGLARALEVRGDQAQAVRVRDEAIAIARRRGDRRALALTLANSYSSRGASSLPTTHAMLLEALELGAELDDPEIRADALGWLVSSYLSLCDSDGARRALAQLFEAARGQNQPFYLYVAEQDASGLALCEGTLGEAEAAADRSHEWSRLLTGRDASAVHGIQMFSIRREQGRLAELAPVVRLLAGKHEGVWRPGLVALLAELECGRMRRPRCNGHSRISTGSVSHSGCLRSPT
jgi:tetratricopeptide (TPR) repeat protein